MWTTLCVVHSRWRLVQLNSIIHLIALLLHNDVWALSPMMGHLLVGSAVQVMQIMHLYDWAGLTRPQSSTASSLCRHSSTVVILLLVARVNFGMKPTILRRNVSFHSIESMFSLLLRRKAEIQSFSEETGIYTTRNRRRRWLSAIGSLSYWLWLCVVRHSSARWVAQACWEIWMDWTTT